MYCTFCIVQYLKAETHIFAVAPEVLTQTFGMRKNMLLFKWWPSQKISKNSTDKSCTVCWGGGKGEGGVFFYQALTFLNVVVEFWIRIRLGQCIRIQEAQET